MIWKQRFKCRRNTRTRGKRRWCYRRLLILMSGPEEHSFPISAPLSLDRSLLHGQYYIESQVFCMTKLRATSIRFLLAIVWLNDCHFSQRQFSLYKISTKIQVYILVLRFIYSCESKRRHGFGLESTQGCFLGCFPCPFTEHFREESGCQYRKLCMYRFIKWIMSCSEVFVDDDTLPLAWSSFVESVLACCLQLATARVAESFCFEWATSFSSCTYTSSFSCVSCHLCEPPKST